jgi:hypothetical protein
MSEVCVQPARVWPAAQAQQKTSPIVGLVEEGCGMINKSFPCLFILLGHLARDKAITGAEEFGDDENVVVTEACGLVPRFPLFVRSGQRDVKKFAAF